jgi:hypothetical protein
MKDVNLQAGLRSLNASVRRIDSLLAWVELKQEEDAKRSPMQFQPYDSTRDDLRNEYAYFLHTSLQIREVLETTLGITVQERQRIARWLARAEARIQELGSHFLYPGFL